MIPPSQWGKKELYEHLQGAVELELLTIPPYMTALCSLHPQTNESAEQIIRSVLVEEMLHLTLAANVFNAVNGKPLITEPGGWVPRYPAKIPFHLPQTFEVGLRPFGEQALDTFLAIENPTSPEVEAAPASDAAAVPRVMVLAEEQGYETIGAFYGAIEEGLKALVAKEPNLFSGDLSRQVGPRYYYGSGGHVIVVKDLATALEALEQIVEQGEGEVKGPPDERMFDDEGELAHFYRFQELQKRRLYERTDEPGSPTGPEIEVNLDAVYPMKPNLSVSELSGELRARAEGFNRIYAELLQEIQEGIDGKPEALARAVGTMFSLKSAAEELLKVPLPDDPGFNAGPTFEYP